MYEHAYHLDFGARAAAYVDQVMANLHWERIGARYREAIGAGESGNGELFRPYGSPAQGDALISAEALEAALEGAEDRRPLLLDLCQPRDLPRRTDMLAGATMHAPAALPQWIEELPRDRPIAVYCICGFQVSGNAVNELRKRGYNARARRGYHRLACDRRADGAPRYLYLRASVVTFRAAREEQGIQQPPLQMVADHPRLLL
jgi:Fe-Mn family superoxide dismutase